MPYYELLPLHDVDEGSVHWLDVNAWRVDPENFIRSGLTREALDHPIVIIRIFPGNPTYYWVVIVTGTPRHDRLPIYHKSQNGARMDEIRRTGRLPDALFHQNDANMEKPSYARYGDVYDVSHSMIRKQRGSQAAGYHDLEFGSLTELKEKAGPAMRRRLRSSHAAKRLPQLPDISFDQSDSAGNDDETLSPPYSAEYSRRWSAATKPEGISSSPSFTNNTPPLSSVSTSSSDGDPIVSSSTAPIGNDQRLVNNQSSASPLPVARPVPGHMPLSFQARLEVRRDPTARPSNTGAATSIQVLQGPFALGDILFYQPENAGPSVRSALAHGNDISNRPVVVVGYSHGTYRVCVITTLNRNSPHTVSGLSNEEKCRYLPIYPNQGRSVGQSAVLFLERGLRMPKAQQSYVNANTVWSCQSPGLSPLREASRFGRYRLNAAAIYDIHAFLSQRWPNRYPDVHRFIATETTQPASNKMPHASKACSRIPFTAEFTSIECAAGGAQGCLQRRRRR